MSVTDARRAAPDSAEPPQANPPLRRGGPPRSPVLAGWLMAWRWLTRMRTALYLLGVLALLSLVATLVPQAPNVPDTVSAWRAGNEGPGALVVSLIDLVGAFDMYGSVLFLGLLILVFTSLTACLLPRYRAWWRIVRHSQPPRSRHVGDQDHVARLVTDMEPGRVDDRVREVLGRRRFRLRKPDDPARSASPPLLDPPARSASRPLLDPPARSASRPLLDVLPSQIAAEKGLALREGGSLLFHTSFWVLLVGIVSGLLLGFEGDVAVVEGEAFADTAISYSGIKAGRWWSDDDHAGFTLTLDEARIGWHRDVRSAGQPSFFESTVTISEPDGSTRTDTVAPNDPLIVDNMRLHQLGWGYAPRVVVEIDGQVVHDAHVLTVETEVGAFRGVIKAPSADPDVGIEFLLWPWAPDDEDGQPITTGAPWPDAPLIQAVEYRGDLGLDGPQRFDTLDKTNLEPVGGAQLRTGASVELGDGVVIRFLELRRWIGFQVSSKPSLPLLLVGGLLVLVGLLPALYAWRRRVWVVTGTDPETGRTMVTVAGRAFQRPQAFDREFPALVGAVRQAIDADPDQRAEP